ncbi:MAG: cytochrome c3 family protein [Bryobacteraceae bacterium]
MTCADCHSGTAERAGFPLAAKCMLCHRAIRKESPAIQSLAALPKDAKPFPQTRVYRLADFVFFSHAKHSAAHIDCARCHGPVMERETLTREFPLTMKSCVDCHKSRQASITCNTCHELNQ